MRRLLRILAWIAALQAVAYLVKRLLRGGVPASPPDPLADEFVLVAAAEAADFGSSAAALRRGTVRTTCAGVHLDLRDATLAPGGARLDLRTVLGATEVVVPPGWRVIARGKAVAGSISTSVTPEATLPAEAPTLIVDARVTLGAVHVRAARPA